MNQATRTLIALGLVHALLSAAHAQADPGLQAVSDLAQVNGQALACQDMPTAQRAKGLMLQHAPKTARFGNAFEEGTHQSYLVQTRSSVPCPDTTAFAVRLDTIAQRLQTSLPVKTTDQ